MFHVGTKTKIGATVATAVLCFGLIVPSAAAAAEGDDATATTTPVVEEVTPPATGSETSEATTPAEEPAEEAPAEEAAPEPEPPVVNNDESNKEESEAPAEDSNEKDSADEQKAPDSSKEDTKSTKTDGDHEKVCDLGESGAVKFDRNANLSEAVVTLKDGYTACKASLYSYETEGATWETSGTQIPVDFDTAKLTPEHPTATLKVDVRGCFQQQDFSVGTDQKFDGEDGALPHYPDSMTPKGVISSYNGGKPCTYSSCPSATKTVPVYEDTAAAQGIGVTFSRDNGTLTWDGDSWVFNTPGSNDKITFGLTSTDYQIPLYELTALSTQATLVQPGSVPGQIVAANVPVDYNGSAAGGFTTIVVEAVYNDDSLDFFQGGDAIVWSSNPIPGYPDRSTFKSWKTLLELNPSAVLLGQMTLNQGGGNAGLISKVTSLTVGNSKECVTYVPKEEKPPVVVPANPAFTAKQVCGSITITYTNEQTLKEGEVGTDAFFELTVADGETQLITVEPNKTVVKTGTFTEDSGDQLVKTGIKGGELVEYTVETDCAPNPYFITPEGVAFRTCEDIYIVPGTLTKATSSTDSETGDVHKTAEYVTSDGTYFVVDNTIDGVQTVKVTFVATDPVADIAPPGETDSYVVVNNTAVWSYTFHDELCPTNPPKPPKPPVTPIDHPDTPRGGIEAGAYGDAPSAAANVSATSTDATQLDGSAFIISMLLLGAVGSMVAVRRRRRATQQ